MPQMTAMAANSSQPRFDIALLEIPDAGNSGRPSLVQASHATSCSRARISAAA
jgi:hypothetical protein